MKNRVPPSGRYLDSGQPVGGDGVPIYEDAAWSGSKRAQWRTETASWGDQDRWPLVRTSFCSVPSARERAFNRGRSRSVARPRRISSLSRRDSQFERRYTNRESQKERERERGAEIGSWTRGNKLEEGGSIRILRLFICRNFTGRFSWITLIKDSRMFRCIINIWYY